MSDALASGPPPEAHLAGRRTGPGASYDGRDLELLNAAQVGFDVAGHRAEFLYWGFYEARPWRNYLHTHSFFEICYAHAGRGSFRTGDHEHAVEEGMVFVARPGDVHEIVSSTQNPLSVHFWSYTLVPLATGAGSGTGAAGGGTTARRGERRGDNGGALLDAFARPGTPVLSHTAGRIPEVLEFLAREAAAPGPAFGAVVAGLASTLLVDTARAVVDDPGLAPGPDPASVPREEQLARTMERYVQDNFDRQVAVRDVAAQVHLSERHAGRLFRSFTGTTIHGYLVRLRLEIAAQRLLAPDSSVRAASISEVARSCGYPDVRHFTTAFRRQFGVTPGVFREGSGTAHLAGPPDGG